MSNVKTPIEFVLGSSSPRRKKLLKDIGIVPDIVFNPNVDERILKNELPIFYVKRMAKLKMEIVHKIYPNSIILTADTIVSVGKRVLTKTSKTDVAKNWIKLLSGRRHKVTTAFMVKTPYSQNSLKYISSIVKFKRLSAEEISFYLKSNEWKNKAGGYAIQGLAGRYINFISGSYSNIVGLPVADVYRVLTAIGVVGNDQK